MDWDLWGAFAGHAHRLQAYHKLPALLSTGAIPVPILPFSVHVGLCPAYSTEETGAHTCRLADAPDVRAKLQFFAGSPLVAPNGYRFGSM
jgi:hypothetical protein